MQILKKLNCHTLKTMADHRSLVNQYCETKIERAFRRDYLPCSGDVFWWLVMLLHSLLQQLRQPLLGHRNVGFTASYDIANVSPRMRKWRWNVSLSRIDFRSLLTNWWDVVACQTTLALMPCISSSSTKSPASVLQQLMIYHRPFPLHLPGVYFRHSTNGPSTTSLLPSVNSRTRSVHQMHCRHRCSRTT